MKVVPTSPAAQPTGQSQAQSSRDRAISAFMQGGGQQPVQNQNAIAPEEMGALQQNRIERKEEDEDDHKEETPEVVEMAAETPETPQVEPTAEEPKESEVKDPALSRQFAQLARQERAMRAKAQQQEQVLAQREAALKAREAELAAKDQEYRSGYISKQQLKQNALAVLEAEGITYDDITQQALNPQTIHPMVQQTIETLKAEIAELKKASETAQKSQTEAQENQYKAAIKQIETKVSNLVNKDPAFETIKATNSIKDVVDLIEQTYKEDGILLTEEEAAQQVEDYLVEEAMKLAKLQKIQKRLQPAPASTTPAEVKAAAQTLAAHAKQAKQTQPMKTLTNASSVPARQMTARERAIAAFKGEKM